MNEMKIEIIGHKLYKAQAFIGEGPSLVSLKFYNTAINKMYYACFHVTQALLLTMDLSPKTHAGMVKSLFLHFVSQGKFDENRAKFLSQILQRRMDDDYGDFLILDLHEIEPFLKPPADYVNYTTALTKELLK
jgi:uncharacterized protein (UPF0332 family)